MNDSPKNRTGRDMLIIGLVLSPSILFLLYRMSEGFDGAYATGFGSMEVFLVPFYLVPVVASIILIGKGLEKMKTGK